MPSKSIVDVQVAIALAEMEVRTAGLTGEALRAELTKFMNEQSVAAEGKVTMLWAGYGKVADRIAEVDNPDIRILNKTVANKVLASPDFMDKVADSFGYDRVEFATYNPESDMGKDKTKFLFNGENGLWAQISKRFAQETTGEVRIMTSAPFEGSVLIKTELEVVIEGIVSGRITKVDGFDSADLRDIDRSKLKSVLLENAVYINFETKPTVLNYNEFINIAPKKILEMITLKSMQVCQGALLACSFGTTPASLGVLPTNKVITNSKPAANIMDHKPMVNIPPFGLCTSLANPAVASATAAALGVLTPMPCIPNTPAPWVPGVPTVLIAGQPAVDNTCKLSCAYAGVIQVSFAGQTNHIF